MIGRHGVERAPLATKVAVVTGASSGVGRATAVELHRLGASVVLGARRGGQLKKVASELDDPGRVAWLETDVCSPEDVRELMKLANRTFQAIDVLVVNAGVGAYGGILDYSDAEVRELIDTNLTGAIWSVRSALPHMREPGDVVIISSVAGLRGRADEAVYAATKHGLVGLAGSLDRELRPRGIRVSVLCPGAVASEFAIGRGRRHGDTDFGRMLTPDDIAAAIATVLTQPPNMRTLLWSMRSMASEN
jgi:3-oxoacyl-[acyl-carrier protein] reductase